MVTAQTYLVYRPDIWSPYIDRLFKEKLYTAKFFRDYSDYVTEGGKSVMIPHDAIYTASSITTTTGELTGNLVADTRSILDIDTWKAASRVFADFQAAQVGKQYRLKEVYAENMAHSLAKALESSLFGLVTAANISRVVNASTAGLKSSDLEAALAITESYSIPKEELIWFFHPKAYFQEVLAVQKYYDASQFGKATISTQKGTHGELYGVPVVISTLVPASNASIEGGAHRNILIHNRAFCYAVGNLPGGQASGIRMQELKSEHLRVMVVADLMYGVKKVGNSYRGVRLISKT